MKFFEYKEHKRHGTETFPLEYYAVTPSHPHYCMPTHWHTECELIRVLKGSLQVNIDEKSYLLKPNNLLFAGEGQLHGATPLDSCEYECLVFDSRNLFYGIKSAQHLIYSVFNGRLNLKNLIPLQGWKLYFFSEELFKTSKTKQVGYQSEVQAYLILLLNNLITLHYHQPTEISVLSKSLYNWQRFSKAVSYIEDNYEQNLTLNDIASYVGMSSKALNGFFYLMSGKTPLHYLNWYRIECATDQIMRGHYLIDVALDCGFSTESYFIKVFKKFKGITPGQYFRSLTCDNRF